MTFYFYCLDGPLWTTNADQILMLNELLVEKDAQIEILTTENKALKEAISEKEKDFASLSRVLSKTADELDKLKAVKDTSQKAAKRTKPKKIPVVHDRTNDGNQTEPIFNSYRSNGNLILKSQIVKSIHNSIVGTDSATDRTFVYALLRRLFSHDELRNQSLSGTTVADTMGNKRKINVLDPGRIGYGYEQFRIRVVAIGRNNEDRDVRSAMNFYKRYITDLTRSAHTMKNYQPKKPKLQADPSHEPEDIDSEEFEDSSESQE